MGYLGLGRPLTVHSFIDGVPHRPRRGANSRDAQNLIPEFGGLGFNV